MYLASFFVEEETLKKGYLKDGSGRSTKRETSTHYLGKLVTDVYNDSTWFKK